MTKNYDVGYKKPPKAHQFKKGQSGNPKGRPKKEKICMADILDKISNETITITENGHSFPTTKFEVAIRRLLAKAISGDVNALKLYVQLKEKYGAQIVQDNSVDAKNLEFSSAIEAEKAYKKLVKSL
jgi:hypothetical protein